ncbi:MAG: DUF2961 domain-containing protein [Tannerellaceae bacterium]|jgi:hypothetical protein|nr:DUF2961 domain-containing protein [Tannerellaceae bacterium]
MKRAAGLGLFSLFFAIIILGGCNPERTADVDLRLLFDEISTETDMFRMPELMWRSGVSSGEINPAHAQTTLIDVRGPGVITRMALQGSDRQGKLRIFFDGSPTAAIEVSTFSVKIPDMPEGFSEGDAASWLPIPYARSCRIVYEAPTDSSARTPKAYHIDYRTYSSRTKVKTFSPRALVSLRKRTARIAQLFQSPEVPPDTQRIEGTVVLGAGEPAVINLPTGAYAISELNLRVIPFSDTYDQTMRDIILQSKFDGLHTMRIPLSDFSGGGMGARPVSSLMMDADGQGRITSRWRMPYREEASLAFINEGSKRARLNYTITLAPIKWEDGRTLYFHASWREILSNDTDSTALEISGGKGIFKGEAYTLYNYTSNSAWLSNGEITAEADGQPLFTAKGLEGYYNIAADNKSAQQTLLGGMIRAGGRQTYGYNSLLRLRLLDGIVFSNSLRIVFRKPAGRIDYAVATYWYGDNKARAVGFAAPVSYSRTLLPSPSAGAASEVGE